MTPKTALRVDDVSKSFRVQRDRPSFLKERLLGGRRNKPEEFWALRDVSLEIKQGSMYGVIGHNGSGKSTLLKLMANIHRPTSGSIAATGRISALLELGTGFHPELSGRENIYLNASILGISRVEIDQRLDDIIDFAGIGEFIDSPVRIYSSGMKVRLGFSVAVHVDPEILLLDEVIAVGDERFKRLCFEHMYSLRQSGVTIVLVTHSMGQVQTMCDEATWLVRGEVRDQGDAVDVAGRYLQEVNDLDGRTGDEAADLLKRDTRGTRRGSQEVEVTGVTFMNGRAMITPFAAAGRPVTVLVAYDAHERVEDPVFALKFHTNSGTVVAAPDMKHQRYASGPIEGPGVFAYSIDELHLLPGTYHVTAGVYDSSHQHVYDERQREFELTVQTGTIGPSGEGWFDLGGRWRPARPDGGPVPGGAGVAAGPHADPA
jgi:ABC-2 type transport system ATP-binding protein/lipopolysaccharide transport system ATP-binding protein